MKQQTSNVSQLTINTPKGRQWRHYGVFIVNFEPI